MPLGCTYYLSFRPAVRTRLVCRHVGYLLPERPRTRRPCAPFHDVRLSSSTGRTKLPHHRSIVFTNMRSGKLGPEHGSGTFNTYYTVVRFNSSGNFTTIGKVYFTMAKSRTTVKRPGSSIVKEPKLFSRSLHLHEKDKICLTVENLDLVYADPIGSYFGIFEL